MTTSDQAKAQSSRMPVWKALLLFLPILLTSLVVWLFNILMEAERDPLLSIAAVLTYLAFSTFFVLMLITGKTHRYRSVLFILVAIAIPLDFIMVVLFPAIGTFAEPLITTTGLTISPNYTGGEVKQTIDHGAYQTQIHRMVFDDTLIGERKKGFIQVDWVPPDGLPARIDEEIDADGDGQADFRIKVDTANKEATLTPYASWVLELEGTYRLEDSLMVRVTLRNPSRV